MTQDKLIYQIVASGPETAAGQAFRAQLGAEPFLIGSGDPVDMQLTGESIQPVHARALVTSTGQVILINLGAPETMSIDGEEMASFKPIYWKPGIPARICDYALQLELLEARQTGEQSGLIRQVLVTQPSEIVHQPQNAPQFVIDWGDHTANNQEEVIDAPPPGKSTMQFTEEEILGSAQNKSIAAAESPDEPLPPPASIYPDQPDDMDGQDRLGTRFVDMDEDNSFADETHRHAIEPIPAADTGIPADDDSDEMARTPDMPFAFHIREATASLPGMSSGVPKMPTMSGTLPKDWQQMGYLSAQATINPVNLVAGERVRVPISVRNGYEHPVQLRVHVAGLPNDQVILPEAPLKLAPGAVGAFDLILQTKVPAESARQELMIRLRDPSMPDAAMTLPLELVFKNAPDITGWLDPTTVWNTNPTYIHLQNHTKAVANVFITGHSDTRGLHVIPTQTQVSVFPGQTTKIPVRIDAPDRRLIRSTRQSFSISAQEGNRAPLDFPGTVRIRARVPVALLALLMAILVIVVVGAVILLSRSDATSVDQIIATETPPQTQVEETQAQSLPGAAGETTAETQFTVMASPSSTATATSTALPPTLTPTESIFEDPRPSDCTVSIPAGWMPYVVQRGDRVYRLAVDRGTTVDEVATVNCLENPRLLFVGNVLLLPPAP